MLNALISIFTSRLTWSFLGTTAISTLIWFFGPIISVGNIVPFKSITIRIITISSLFLVWILSRLIPRLYRLWFNKKLENQLKVNQDKKTETKQNEKYITLAERFSDAAKLLKKAYFSGLYDKNKPHWTNLFSRQYIYQLPWYLVIGVPNSGKTTVLANSGLHFSLTDYLGNSTPYNIHGMDDFNWWFTNNAVFLDTAGRYTNQTNSHNQDANEWKNFILLLKKYRARQPINGIIVTISVEDLLNPSTEARNKQAYVLSKRLSELNEKFKIQIPIYIFITKSDLLKGFSAYFTHFDKASREQIWGFNFPWKNKQRCDLNKVFEQQYNELQLRLDAELPYVLLNGHNLRQCTESYLFPQEVASLRPLIAQYLEIVFAKSGFEIPCYPRGLYFTSGTQEGTPLDNVMAQFNQKLKLPIDNDSNLMSWGNDNGIIHPLPARQTYFLKSLLENIFQEAGIAGYNRWWIYRKRLLDGVGYIILIAILAFISKLFLTSYHNNNNYLMEIQSKIPVILNQGSELKKNPDNIYALLPLLNSLAHLDKSQNFSLDDPPLSYRMGLYSGEQVSEASLSLYNNALQTLLLPQVAKLITNQLHNEDGDDIERTYNTLKAYQMLYQTKYYDGKFLRNWVMQYLETHLDVDVTQKQLKQINGHLSQLLDNQAVTSPFMFDSNLVKQKQALISKIPPAQRAYNYLKSKLLDDPDLAPVNLDTLAGPQARLVFSSVNGTSFTNYIPGMFTPVGYQKGVDKDLDFFLKTLHSQDNWVLGTYARTLAIKEIKSFVKQLYINDYIFHWDQFLADIRLSNINSLEQRTNTARLLSSSDSPLRNLVINISKNVELNKTLLNKDNIAAKQLNKVVKRQSDKLTQLASKQPLASKSQLVPKQIVPDNQQDTPEQELENHFAQITALVKSPDVKNNQKIPFDDTLKNIGELYQYLTSVQSAIKTDMPFPPNDIITQLQAASERLPVPFRSMVYSLAVGASNDTQLNEMKNVARHLGAEVGTFCNQAIANRYPLTPNTSYDIRPDDMARMFAPETGLMDSFFQKNLMGKVDTTLQRWRFMPGVNGKPLPGGEALLRPFQQAQIIRNALFTSGTPTPLFKVMVRPVSMDNNILSMILDIDGQKLEYSHGPQFSQLISWPGPAKKNHIHIQLNLSNGTTANFSISGFWALNRLLDLAKQPHNSNRDEPSYTDDMSLRAIFNIKGYTFSLDFIPSSVFNPFKLPVFSCPRSQNLAA
ncbi:type VI secretion system membrane subunit TssM [Xenorhabdus sp. Vera]|uniref:type VI secretion system membrane subunit TssM n=1 Tax=Xenorhabdus koppenhoeferi TaxID=351659 RepID=UPI00199C0783|nr:type VI secretion system membrane subunit TssM [Xenorhabdus sp. Vera]MBD2810669.1 type VI secretion system membrane subunit TssM [Xenorhabdus sp. Vera]